MFSPSCLPPPATLCRPGEIQSWDSAAGCSRNGKEQEEWVPAEQQSCSQVDALCMTLLLETKDPSVRLLYFRGTRTEIFQKSLRVLHIWNLDFLDVEDLNTFGCLPLWAVHHSGNLKLCVFVSRSGRWHKSSFAWLTNFLAKWAWNFHDTAK